MKKIFFTVGPSETYPTLDKHFQQAMHEQIASLSHRGSWFETLYGNVEKKLKSLLSIPDDYAVFFLGSSIEAMERIIQNTVESSSFHFVDGAFSQKAAAIAKDLGKQTGEIPAPESSAYNFRSIKIPKAAELIFITENDTSTGLIFPHSEIYQLKKKYPEKLIAVDLVSSAPYSSIDFSKIDLAFFSGQKGFGIPAGLSVLIVSPQAIEKSEHLKKKGVLIGSYHSFPSLKKSRSAWQTPETPNVLAIYLFEKVLSDMKRKGITTIRQEINEKAEILYSFFEREESFTPFIKDRAFRSPSTLVIEVRGGSKLLREDLAKQGMVVGSGYGFHKDSHIRIANFPAHTTSQIEKLLDSLRKYC
jgi:phosphoserine aminotransferase